MKIVQMILTILIPIKMVLQPLTKSSAPQWRPSMDHANLPLLWEISPQVFTYCYFTRLNPKRKGPFYFCIVKVPLSDFFPKVSQAPSKCFSKWINWINWIISRIPCWIWKILFVLGSYEFLAMLEGKIWKCPFSRVQSDEITVWSV